MSKRQSPRAVRGDRRAQSEILGVVLLIGVVVIAVGLLAMYGNAAVADNEKRIAVERAENGLEQFDTRASRVALGESDPQVVDVGVTGTSGSLDTRPNDGWMRVIIVNATTGVDEVVVANETLGALVYRSDDTTVAYQGGGVWRSDGDGSVMVSRPEFHVRNNTLTLPIIVTTGDDPVYSEVQVAPDESHPNGSFEQKFPDPERNLTNKVEQVKLRITVQSDYYQAWGRYFEDHTDGYVVVDDAAKTASVTYLALPKWFGLDSGIIATSGAGEIRLVGNSIYIDSYDSSLGSGRYTDTQSANGSITAVNDIVATGSSNVQGDVRAGGTVDLSGTTGISGTVYWTDGYSPNGAAVNGGDEQIDGVATIEPIDGYVENVVADARVTNNNSDTGVVNADDEFTGTGTLTAGTYYFDSLAISSGEKLTLDTSGGDVYIAVANGVTFTGQGTQDTSAAKIEVTGGGTAHVFVLGGGTTDFEMNKNSQVIVPDENSSQFRVYGTSDFDAVITSDQSPAQIRFEGVIYAPAGFTGTGSVIIGQAEFFGAIISGDLTIKQGGEIHYDEALRNARFPRSPTIPHIEFMHVSVHRIGLTSG
jgi:flagellin-like protein